MLLILRKNCRIIKAIALSLPGYKTQRNTNKLKDLISNQVFFGNLQHFNRVANFETKTVKTMWIKSIIAKLNNQTDDHTNIRVIE